MVTLYLCGCTDTNCGLDCALLRSPERCGTWRSPVAHLNGVQGAAGSNPAVPIKKNPRLTPGFFFFAPPRFRRRLSLRSSLTVKSLFYRPADKEQLRLTPGFFFFAPPRFRQRRSLWSRLLVKSRRFRQVCVRLFEDRYQLSYK
jgi:hypothetical protein